jgi:heme/copper-type cytochrome/quinol oxidase subunit 4
VSFRVVQIAVLFDYMHRSTPPREDWQMDIAIFALVAIVVIVAGVYVMRPEKK